MSLTTTPLFDYLDVLLPVDGIVTFGDVRKAILDAIMKDAEKTADRTTAEYLTSLVEHGLIGRSPIGEYKLTPKGAEWRRSIDRWFNPNNHKVKQPQ